MRDDVDIEGVLNEHQMVSTTSGACTCGAGETDPLLPTGVAIRTHRAHVAAVLRKQFNAALTLARVDAANKATARAAHLSDTERAGDAE